MKNQQKQKERRWCKYFLFSFDSFSVPKTKPPAVSKTTNAQGIAKRTLNTKQIVKKTALNKTKEEKTKKSEIELQLEAQQKITQELQEIVSKQKEEIENLKKEIERLKQGHVTEQVNEQKEKNEQI